MRTLRTLIDRFLEIRQTQSTVDAIKSTNSYIYNWFINAPRWKQEIYIKRILLNGYLKQRYPGKNFFKQDWDNLLILDSCRPDTFEEINNLEGEYTRRMSLGASSAEFFIENFDSNHFHDTVYVTGNGHIGHVSGNSLHRIIRTHGRDTDHRKGWLPETTFDVAIQAYEDHPHKRLVVHFMQPHSPYLGERADQLRERVANKYDVNFRYMQLLDDSKQTDGEHIGSLLSALENGYISHDEFVGVYKENLQIALRYVKELLDRIEGKTVITADHSESFGEFKGIYGHDNYALSRDLREVPWFVIDESRRETFSEQPIETKHISDESVRENLRDLGYL